MANSRWITVLLLLAVVSACGSESPAEQPGRPAAEQTADTATEPVANPGTVRLSATAIRTTRTGVEIDVDLPAGAPGCGGRPRVRVDGGDPNLVRVKASVPTSGAPECITSKPGTLQVALDLRGRDIEMNTELWELGPGSAFARCGGMGCDPPTDRCDPAYTHEIGAGAEIPQERFIDVLACEAPWLVADVRAVVTGCQSVDGSTPPPSCDVFSTRWFAHLEEEIWQVVASGKDGGCAEVLAQVADFPRHLCADLPPLAD